MFPAFASSDPTHEYEGHIVYMGNLAKQLPIIATFSNVLNVFLRQLGTAIINSSAFLGVVLSVSCNPFSLWSSHVPLSRGILEIFALSSKPQVIRVYARWIITYRAIVADI